MIIDEFKSNTKTKKLVVKNEGIVTLIAERQEGKKKPVLIDVAMGDFSAIVQDLENSGYEVEILA